MVLLIEVIESKQPVVEVNEEPACGGNAFGKKMRSTGLHVYTDRRIMELTARFKHMKFIREGGFGEIYVGNIGNQMVALKKAKDGVCSINYHCL